MRMANFRSSYGARRLALGVFLLVLLGFFLLPHQLQTMFQGLGGPVGWVLSWPVRMVASIEDGIGEVWYRYLALQGVEDENRRLKKEIEQLQGQNSQLREAASATERLTALLEFKAQALPTMVAAQVIGRNTDNWYRTIILNKGTSDGIRPDMGVVTSAGVVGRIVKATLATSVVLLVSDPNNAIAGLIQRTRDEGIVEGTTEGLARLKYIPLLSNVRSGDHVVTSGLVGGFPRGLAIGTITKIDKEEGALFQSAEVRPEVDVTRVEEVLVIQSSYGANEESQGEGLPSVKTKP
ncbi:MAG TPA: rod shape-determining protein MreC [Nitrospira sp.]|nr:rod shape-determining protein MreC [Nitrospira sp.]